VEAYFARDIQKDLALGRSQLVALAMLLGGDYTDGGKFFFHALSINLIGLLWLVYFTNFQSSSQRRRNSKWNGDSAKLCHR